MINTIVNLTCHHKTYKTQKITVDIPAVQCICIILEMVPQVVTSSCMTVEVVNVSPEFVNIVVDE